jgi:YrbI family 3-deoxy-D-manno-octulosonate 8-phosphate phosphatase
MDGMVKKSLPGKIELVVFDFDGVFTDNRVWVGEDGSEFVACNRSDGHGISMLKDAGFDVLVLSSEKNNVTRARCRKLGVECINGLKDKATTLNDLIRKRNISRKNLIYVGNDVNDVGCMKLAGFSVAVADALAEAKKTADMILKSRGGHGAVRELCDLILSK